jgi:hypothetical protein
MCFPRAVCAGNSLGTSFAKRSEQRGFAAGADQIDIKIDLGYGNHEVVCGHK